MADAKLLGLLKSGVEGWNSWREKNPLATVYLFGVDLREVDLRRVDLSDVDLRRANLSGLDLSGADFSRADLSGADLKRATLRAANLLDATFVETNLQAANLQAANLFQADLRRAILKDTILLNADLRNATCSGSDLAGADFSGADLSGASFFRANLQQATLIDATLLSTDFSGADLRNTIFSGAAFLGATLKDATFSGATLKETTFSGVDLSSADFSGLKLISTSGADCDLSRAKGLAGVLHSGPSGISTSTLERTAAGLADAAPGRQAEVETFLRGAGVSEHFVEYFRGLIGRPVEFYTLFISYSHPDKKFAQRLYNDLQMRGIRCWLDEHDLRLGDRIFEVVNQAIRSRDKVILCSSLAALTSKWVDRELAAVLEQEERTGRDMMIPLDLDGYLFDGYVGSKGPVIRERLAGDFVGWKQDADKYEAQLERVIAALKAGR